MPACCTAGSDSLEVLFGDFPDPSMLIDGDIDKQTLGHLARVLALGLRLLFFRCYQRGESLG